MIARFRTAGVLVVSVLIFNVPVATQHLVLTDADKKEILTVSSLREERSQQRPRITVLEKLTSLAVWQRF